MSEPRDKSPEGSSVWLWVDRLNKMSGLLFGLMGVAFSVIALSFSCQSSRVQQVERIHDLELRIQTIEQAGLPAIADRMIELEAVRDQYADDLRAGEQIRALLMLEIPSTISAIHQGDRSAIDDPYAWKAEIVRAACEERLKRQMDANAITCMQTPID